MIYERVFLPGEGAFVCRWLGSAVSSPSCSDFSYLEVGW